MHSYPYFSLSGPQVSRSVPESPATARTLISLALLLGLSNPAAAGKAVEADPIQLEEVTVSSQSEEEEVAEEGAVDRAGLASGQARTSDTASLFKDIPGVSVNTGGGVSSLPAVHGMADERVKVQVNGMNISSACSNHMNPPLSYVDPSNVGKAMVMAGITPVSQGGDSIGGTIAVDPLAPKFASEKEGSVWSGTLSNFFRSANNNFGNSLSTRYADRDFTFDYNGAWSKGTSYYRGNDGLPVVPSQFLSTNHFLRAATKLDGGLLSFDVTGQYIPYQGFPNQRMDVTGNEGVLGGLNYEKNYDWGKLDARLYYHYTWHTMDTLPERNIAPMLMKATGSDLGYRVRGHIPMGDGHTLRVGNEFFRQTLQDWWPGGNTNPQDFISVKDGERNRMAIFGEWQTDWDDHWTTQLGVRNDIVWMDAGRVHGYNNDFDSTFWATPFNAANRARTDVNFDVTAMVRYLPNASSQYELGFARKMRAPNLYERYAWDGHNSMINWFGDGNSYQGNLKLTSETAYNFSFSAAWHDPSETVWSVKVSPYYTHVDNYIWGQTENIYSDGFRGMQFVNLPYADLYGVDASGRYAFLRDSPAGTFALRATLAYVRGVGENGMRGRPCPYAGTPQAAICTGQNWSVEGLQSPDKVNLYHMMPLHGSLSVEHDIDTEWGSFANMLGVELVDRKTAVATTYGEPETPGYALLNLRTSYQHKKVRMDLGVDNLLDKLYYHPLGGVYIVQTYNPQSYSPSNLPAVPAMGRSVYFTVNLEF